MMQWLDCIRRYEHGDPPRARSGGAPKVPRTSQAGDLREEMGGRPAVVLVQGQQREVQDAVPAETGRSGYR
jgi:hypothetical protein